MVLTLVGRNVRLFGSDDCRMDAGMMVAIIVERMSEVMLAMIVERVSEVMVEVLADLSLKKEGRDNQEHWLGVAQQVIKGGR